MTVSAAASQADAATISDGEARALARAVVSLFRVWELRDADALAILGGLHPGTWRRWSIGCVELVDRDRKQRMRMLVEIHMALRAGRSGPGRGHEWVRQRSAAFGGRSALQVMTGGRLEDLAVVRDRLASTAA